jgi:DNA-binding transcriptional ArsR family regulator
MTDPIEKNTEQQADIFGALADPTRLKLVKLLCRQPSHGALCVNALANVLGVTQSAVSQHLRVLRVIGLVKGKRCGYHIHYSMNMEVLEHYRKMVSEALRIEDSQNENLCENYCNRKEE